MYFRQEYIVKICILIRTFSAFVNMKAIHLYAELCNSDCTLSLFSRKEKEIQAIGKIGKIK